MGGLVGQLALLACGGLHSISGAVLFGHDRAGLRAAALWRNLRGRAWRWPLLIYGVFDRLLRLNLPGGPLGTADLPGLDAMESFSDC
jgi:hypothetical protein